MRTLVVLIGGLLAIGILASAAATLDVCSFNIQFLGHFKDRDNAALASILSDYDIVVIQELVAPPYPLTFPDGTAARADDEARWFFEAMICSGFSYWLSEEDTGPGESNHANTTGTEWWVTFYKPEAVEPARDLPWGFLDEDRTANPDYERVPYAFAFRSQDGSADFVLVSVHLDPDSGQRRREEITAVADWISATCSSERDFIILGDMNIQSAQELTAFTPAGYDSLNAYCLVTNTAANGKPYDHVLYRPESSGEVQDSFEVIDLVDVMRTYWTSDSPYPGEPYDHNAFRIVYSDHCPVVFAISGGGPDDD